MGEDPDWGQVGLLQFRLALAPRAPGVTPAYAPIRDWPQMRCAMGKRKKPGGARKTQ